MIVQHYAASSDKVSMGTVSTDKVSTDKASTDKVFTDMVSTDKVSTDKVSTDKRDRQLTIKLRSYNLSYLVRVITYSTAPYRLTQQ